MSTPVKETPRGIKNNNPGNIMFLSGVRWIGMSGHDEGYYCIFRDPVYGIRAGMVIWENYKYYHGITTIADAIRRWAPSPLNPTDAYTDFVSERVHVSAYQSIDFCNYAVPIARAVCTFENGIDPYTDAQYARALNLAHLR